MKKYFDMEIINMFVSFVMHIFGAIFLMVIICLGLFATVGTFIGVVLLVAQVLIYVFGGTMLTYPYLSIVLTVAGIISLLLLSVISAQAEEGKKLRKFVDKYIKFNTM